MKLVLDIKGKNKLIANFKKFAKEGEEETKKVTEFKALEIEAEAKRLAPVDMGELRQNIVAVADRKRKGLKWSIIAFANYAAYVEFGTGKKVTVPDEFKDMAAEFKGKGGGSFEEGLKRIKAWCKRKGIDEDAAYPIFMSLLNVGMEPHPFLYPAFKKGEQTYKKDLEFVFQLLIDKYST